MLANFPSVQVLCKHAHERILSSLAALRYSHVGYVFCDGSDIRLDIKFHANNMRNLTFQQDHNSFICFNVVLYLGIK